MANAGALSAFLLLALAGGFLFANWFRFTGYFVARAEGQELYLITAVAAVTLLAVSRLFLSLAQYAIPEPCWRQARQVWVAFAGPIETPGLATFSGAFLLGVILAPLANRGLNAILVRRGTSVSRFVIEKYGTELEKFLYESIRHRLPISIALDNRKVYVGFVWGLPSLNPRQDAKDYIRLLPLRSGYRNGDTLELELTTQYTDMYLQIFDEAVADLNIEDFVIVLPLEKFVSVNLYAIDVDPELFKLPPKPTLLSLLTDWIARQLPGGAD